MKSGCSDTFYEKNCYDEVQQCIDDQMALPGTEGDRLDGRSLGCRTLHASFAAVNEEHCPHISFVPEYDVDCFLKCQKSANNSLADAFHPTELAFFKQYGISSLGIGEDEFLSPSIFGPPPP